MQYNNYVQHYKVDGEYYDYFIVDKFMQQELRRRYEQFLQLADLAKNARLLEIGSGGGPALPVLKGRDINYCPLDISFRNLKRIKEMAGFNINPVTADVFRLPYKKNTFDCVFLSEVLEHLSDPAQALAEIRRVIKKNGKLVISVPYKERITYQICIHCNKPTPTHSHLHSFDKKSLERLISGSRMAADRFVKNFNKVPNRLYIYRMLKHMPFFIWKAVDRVFNIIIDKPTSLILVCRKPDQD